MVFSFLPLHDVYADDSEVLSLRTETSKTFDIGNGIYRYVGSISVMHYKNNYSDNNEQWKDIDLTFANGQITKAPYTLTVYSDAVIGIVDKKTGSFVSINLASLGSKIKGNIAYPIYKDNKVTFKDITIDTDIVIEASNTSVKFKRIIKSNKASPDATFTILKTILKDKDGKDGFDIKYYATDNSNNLYENKLPITANIVGNTLTETIDLSKVGGVTYPITIDPTVDIASASNSPAAAYYNESSTTWTLTVNYYWQIGYYNYNYTRMGAGGRWANVTVPHDAVINNAHVTMKALDSRSINDCYAYIVGDDEDNAADWSTLANYQSRRGVDVGGANDNLRTTAEVTWTLSAWVGGTTYDTPDIKTVIQEIVNRGGWVSGNYMALFIDDHDNRSTACVSPPTCATSFGANRAGTQVGSDYFLYIDYAPFAPDIEDQAASNKTGTSARLNANIVNDGGEASTIRFGWDIHTHACNVAAYANQSGWLPDTYASGTSPYWDISGLTCNTTYFFCAEALNSGGNDTGGELTFSTEACAASGTAPTFFNGMPATTSISLTWTRVAGSDFTMIRYGKGCGASCPVTSNTTGTMSYNGTLSYYILTGLDHSTEYCFYAFANGWSTANVSLCVATMPPSTVGDALPSPTQPSRWFGTAAPDYTRQADNPFYSSTNMAIDYLGGSRATWWLAIAIMFSFLVGAIFFAVSHKAIIGIMVMVVMMVIGYFMWLIPLWIPAFVGAGALFLILQRPQGAGE